MPVLSTRIADIQIPDLQKAGQLVSDPTGVRTGLFNFYIEVLTCPSWFKWQNLINHKFIRQRFDTAIDRRERLQGPK